MACNQEVQALQTRVMFVVELGSNHEIISFDALREKDLLPIPPLGEAHSERLRAVDEFPKDRWNTDDFAVGTFQSAIPKLLLIEHHRLPCTTRAKLANEPQGKLPKLFFMRSLVGSRVRLNVGD